MEPMKPASPRRAFKALVLLFCLLLASFPLSARKKKQKASRNPPAESAAASTQPAQPSHKSTAKSSSSKSYSQQAAQQDSAQESLLQGESTQEEAARDKPDGLALLERAYPDLHFDCRFDEARGDWHITLTMPDQNGVVVFYWCEGSMLPEAEIENRAKYWTLLYPYPAHLKDPAAMSDEEREHLREFSSASNRRNGSGTPMFFFEAIYGAQSRASLEANLASETFLGKKTTVHKRIVPALKRVESRILEAAKTDEAVRQFVDGLKSADAYNWRRIAGTNRLSFHSLGIAVDVLPKRITGEIFWSWARDKNPDGWMLTPISRRWTPPQAVIDIFEDEGFIWGGKWAIWDNMHFEYHPELILYQRETGGTALLVREGEH